MINVNISRIWTQNVEEEDERADQISKFSVARSGDLWNALPTNFITKVAQMFSVFLGRCEKHWFSSQNWLGYFLGNFWKTWATFLFQHLVTLHSNAHTQLFLCLDSLALSRMKKLLCNHNHATSSQFYAAYALHGQVKIVTKKKTGQIWCTFTLVRNVSVTASNFPNEVKYQNATHWPFKRFSGRTSGERNVLRQRGWQSGGIPAIWGKYF